MLRDYISKINATAGEATTNDIISRSAYITFLGSSDLTNIYPLVKHLYNEDSYTDLIINLATDFYHKLYAIGARRIGLLTLPPTGCAPALRTLDGRGQRVCSESLNRCIKLFNSKLDSVVERMNRELQGAKVVLFDLYNPAISIIKNPAAYGIEEVKRGCCGTENIETAGLCSLSGTCDDAGKYFLWDSFHPSEAATRILAYRAHIILVITLTTRQLNLLSFAFLLIKQRPLKSPTKPLPPSSFLIRPVALLIITSGAGLELLSQFHPSVVPTPTKP